MSKVYNNSKSALVLQKYTPEDIQKLLNSGKFKSEIVRQLKVNIRAFNIYIKEHNLSYTPPPYKVWKSLAKNKSEDKFKEPLEKFKEMFEENKRKRTIKELEDAYY